MSDKRVCVIGGGVVGLATAYFLTERGLDDVVVLEADYVASASSGLSVGIVETQYMEPLDIALRVRAMQFFNRMEREAGLDIVRNGYLRVSRDEESMKAAARSVEIQRELGVKDARVLEQKDIAALIPEMKSDDMMGGLFGPSDGFIDGHLYCQTLVEILESRGVAVKVKHPVREIQDLPSGGHRVVVDQSRSFDCDYVVNASGAWAREVGEMAGVPTNVIPQRHQAAVMVTNKDYGYLIPSVMDYIPHSGEAGLYFRHEREGRLVTGLHSEEMHEVVTDPSDYHRSAHQEFLEELAAKLEVRLPGFPDAGLGDGWAGLYPISPDGVPQVGPNPGKESFISAVGAGGSGIQLSPVMGEIVAAWIVDGNGDVVDGGSSLHPDRSALQDQVEVASD